VTRSQTQTITIGFGVSNPDDVVMEVTPGFEYKGAFFTH
jgi:hypothetical protein